jgi:hypothetical protein
MPFANSANQITKVSEDSGVAWRHNALRHSFVSYRLAIVKNENQVAMEAGNSPQMIFNHYREVVTPEQAAAWFAISPPLPKAAAAAA